MADLLCPVREAEAPRCHPCTNKETHREAEKQPGGTRANQAAGSFLGCLGLLTITQGFPVWGPEREAVPPGRSPQGHAHTTHTCYPVASPTGPRTLRKAHAAARVSSPGSPPGNLKHRPLATSWPADTASSRRRTTRGPCVPFLFPASKPAPASPSQLGAHSHAQLGLRSWEPVAPSLLGPSFLGDPRPRHFGLHAEPNPASSQFSSLWPCAPLGYFLIQD